MPVFERANARFSYPVNLKVRFFEGGVLIDPEEIIEVEIWRGGEGAANGGVLVDTIAGIHTIRDAIGQYRIIWDPYLEGSSPLSSPGVQGHGSPNQGVSPNDPTNIVPQSNYYDVWYWKNSAGAPTFKTVGLSFYLFPDFMFVDSGTEKFRFEMKPDRKRIVKGEKLDIRLGIIPIPLYRSRREPIVDYLLPISTMRAKVVDPQNNEVVPWTDLQFTGKEGILPTSVLATSQLGEYSIVAELTLPNGDTVRYPKVPIQLVD